MITCDPLLYRLGCAGFGGLMSVAALHKLGSPARFRAVLQAHRLMPNALTGAASVVIPIMEITAGLPLLFGLPDLMAAPLIFIAFLLSLYALAMAVNLRRGNILIDCGCLGIAAQRPRLRWSMVRRNLALAAMAAGIAALEPANRDFIWLDWIGLGAGLTLLGLLYAAFDLVLSLPRPEAAP